MAPNPYDLCKNRLGKGMFLQCASSDRCYSLSILWTYSSIRWQIPSKCIVDFVHKRSPPNGEQKQNKDLTYNICTVSKPKPHLPIHANCYLINNRQPQFFIKRFQNQRPALHLSNKSVKGLRFGKAFHLIGFQ